MADSNDNTIGVKVVVDPTAAQQGSNEASKAIKDAADSINSSLKSVTQASTSTAAAVRSGFSGLEGELRQLQQQIASLAGTVASGSAAIVSSLNQIPAAGRNAAGGLNGVAHASAGVRRELLVLGHEAVTGNWTRFGGSLLVLGERMNILQYLTGPVGVGLGVIGAAIGAMVIAAVKGNAELTKLQNNLILTGNAAGLTESRWEEMAKAVSDADSKLTVGQGRQAVSAVAGTGAFGPAAVQAVATAVAEISRLSGESADKVAADYAKMTEGVYKWANSNKEARDLVTTAEAEHARQLEEVGKKEEAEIYIAEAVSAHLKQIQSDLGITSGLWDEVKKAASTAWDAMEGIGRGTTIEQKIGELQDRKRRIADSQTEGLDALGGGFSFQGDTAESLDKQLAALQKIKKERDDKATADAKQAETNRLGKEASAALVKDNEQLHAKSLLLQKIDEYQRNIAASTKAGGFVPSAQDQKDQIAKWTREFNGGEPKAKKLGVGGAGAVNKAEDNGELALLKDKLSFEEKELERSYKANELTLADYYAQRKRITQQGMEAEIAVAQRGVANAENAAKFAVGPNQQAQAQAAIITAKNRVALLNQQLDEQEKTLTEEMKDQQKVQDGKLKTIQQQTQQTAQLAAITRQQTIATAQVSMGQLTTKQLLAQEMQYENQRYQIALEGFTKRMALETTTVEQKAQLNSQLEALEESHQQKILQLQLQEAEDSQKAQKQFVDSIESDFTTFFDSISSGTKSVKQAFIDLAQSITKTLTQTLSRQLVQNLFGGNGNTQVTGSQGLFGGMLKSLTNGLFGTDGGANGGVAGEAQGGLAQAWGKLMGMAGQAMGGMGGSGGSMAGGFSSLFGSGVGSSGAEAGSFGFTTGLEGTGDAVAAGAASDAGGSGMSALMGLAAYAKGTNYVPETGLAMLHKGEAVVPAAYNNGGGGGRSMSAKIQNNFYLPQTTDLRTQSQIAMAAGGGIQTAMRRNG